MFLQVSDRIAVTPSTGRGAIHQGNPATEWAQSDKGATEQGAGRTRWRTQVSGPFGAGPGGDTVSQTQFV